MSTIFRPNRLANYDEESILSEIRRVINEYFQGKPPRIDEFEKLSLVRGKAIRNRFGTWAEAVKKAGFEYRGKNYAHIVLKRAKFSKEQMLSDLQRVKELNGGKYFSRSFYKANGGKYCGETLKKYFNCSTWQALLEGQLSIDLPVVKIKKQRQESRKVSTSIPLVDLEKVADEHGGILTFQKYRNLGGSHSMSTFIRHFGSWKAAVNKVGRRHGGEGRYSDEELFAEIQRLWELNANQPTARIMDRDGKISVKAFINRFGSWSKAVHAFCEDRASIQAEKTEDDRIPNIVKRASIKEEPIDHIVIQSDKPISKYIETIITATPRVPSLRLRFRVMQRDNFRCVLCGRSPANNLGLELQIDHIIPYSQNGPTILENLRTLCKDCNLGKSDIMP